MNPKEETIATYQKSAAAMAAKFDKIGPRTADIEEVFQLRRVDDPFVLEIGCGNGRDAEEICRRTEHYLGVDVAREFILMAMKRVPRGTFVTADIESFQFPPNLDIIFAFASLLHLNIHSLRGVLKRAHDALGHNGVLRLSLKFAENYTVITKEDEFGTRTYYLYSKKDMRSLLRHFMIRKLKIVEISGQRWIEIIAQTPAF